MANLFSLARPYASAAFQVAREKNQITEWDVFLKSASTLCQDSQVIRLLNNPETNNEKAYSLFVSVLASVSQKEHDNLLKLMANNKRLLLLPEVSSLFIDYKRALEKISSVKVITAVPITEDYQIRLSQALGKRIKYEVNLKPEVDPTIIGGAIIYIGDYVIDGSVKGKLNRLMEKLTG